MTHSLSSVHDSVALWRTYDPTKRHDRRKLRAQADALCHRSSQLSDDELRLVGDILGQFIDKMPRCNDTSKTKVELQYWHRYALAVQYARKPKSDVALALAQPPPRPQHGMYAPWTTGNLGGQRGAYTACIFNSCPNSRDAALASIQGTFSGGREAGEMLNAMKFFLERDEDANAITAWRKLWFLHQE